jgi:tape measure domain-containing protein
VATDLDRLVVQLSADIRKFERRMANAAGITNKTANKMERRLRTFDKRLDQVGGGLRRTLLGTTAALSTALSVREVKRYADAWTQAGNKIRASSQVAGRAGRSLEGVIEIANESRTGLAETSDLYAKLLRATKDVAQSELEVARATLIVNKAFKAGGAALSEQRAGILQLSQALGSGLLQGDELRSVRENAPLIAQALAKEFNTSIAGLKKLGADGELAIDRVFRAILNAQPEIEAAFAKTNATIADSFTRISNAFAQYIGQTDAALGTSQRLVSALSALADNFEETADIALKFAGIIAAGLLGRSITRMVTSLALGGAELIKFGNAIRFAATGTRGAVIAGAFGAGIGGPIAGAIGIGAAALTAYTLIARDSGDANAVAARKAQIYAEALKDIAEAAAGAGEAVDDAAETFVAAETLTLKKSAESFRKDIEAAKDDLRALLDEAISFITVGGSLSLRRGPEFQEIKKALEGLRGTIGDADFDTAEFLDKLSKIGDQRPEFEAAALGANSVVERIDALVLSLEKAIERTSALSAGMRVLGEAETAFRDKQIDRRLDEENRRRGEFLQKREVEAGRTDSEKALDAQIEKVKKSFEKAEKAANELGFSLGELTESAARQQAITELAEQATQKLTQTQLDAAKNLILGNEGRARLTPFRDINERGGPDELRIGFSSDTVTLLDQAGNEIVQKVVAGMVITMEDAMRDFVRRIREGREEIAGQIGQERFDALTATQQAVLSDIEYNFGRLPGQVVKALIEGDAGDVAREITKLGVGNLNQRRRAEGGELFLQGAGAEIQLREGRLRFIRETSQAITEQNNLIALETGLIGESNAALEAATLRQELYNILAAEQIPITAELSAQIEALVAQRFAEVAANDAATAASERLKDAQEELARVQQQIAGAFQGAIKGFISDLVAGKSATEALTSAVGRLADRLLDIALNQIFASLFGAAGGLQGGGGFLAFLSARDGGQVRRLQHGGLIRGPGGPRDDKVPVLASNREFIVNARATKANLGLLEAINNGSVKSFADGGFLGSRKPGIVGSPGFGGTAPAPVVNNNVINTFDAAGFLSEALASPEGENIMLNFVSARPAAFSAALQG